MIQAERVKFTKEGIDRAHTEKKANGADRGDSFGDQTARQIMAAEPQAAAYCVAERVPAGLVVIGARPKAKKSWWALQLTIASATSGTFMGKPAFSGRALYLALEDNQRRMRRRFEFFGLTPATAPDNLHLVYHNGTRVRLASENLIAGCSAILILGS